MTRVRLASLCSISLSVAAGCATEPLDRTAPDDPAGGVTTQPILGPGNPFNYSSARDEQLACFGMASGIASNCDDIVDSDDRQMCRAVSLHSADPCFLIADRDLLLACQGLAPFPHLGGTSGPCSGISNPDMQKFCNAYVLINSTICDQIPDTDVRFMCHSHVGSLNSGFCGGISNTNDSLFCEGVTMSSETPCLSIH